MRNRSASLPDSVPDSPESVQLPRFRSNIPSRQNRRLVGRDAELAEILTRLGPTSNSAALVLHGSPGVGKSELAREFGRRHRSAYPGGTFVIDGSSGSLFADFAAIGKNILGLNFLADTSLPDQGGRTFYALQAPVLLIYDNVRSPQSISPWLTPADMAGHILITTVVENWEPGWSSLEVKPLSQEQSLELIEELAGRDIATRYGQELANLAGGLPVQICPPAAVLAYEQRRGHLDSAVLTLSAEAVKTFLGELYT
jgi:hypothetical protein